MNVPAPSSARDDWRRQRALMEATGRRHTRGGVFPNFNLQIFIASLSEPFLKALGLQSRALSNTLALELTEVDVPVRGLPAEFDNYKILQLSDLHVDQVPGLLELAAGRVKGLSVDLTIITGDVQSYGFPAAARAAENVASLTAGIDSRDGFLGILGNHDCHHLVEHLESRGIRMLVNEHVLIERGEARLHLTGVDDVHMFYTKAAGHALRARPKDIFSIALVHSSDFADVAADAGYALYLSGHTHGGQICLPGGRPLMTGLEYHRALARGLWRYGDMTGYTSRGIGITIRARFNCPPEIALLRLRRLP